MSGFGPSVVETGGRDRLPLWLGDVALVLAVCAVPLAASSCNESEDARRAEAVRSMVAQLRDSTGPGEKLQRITVLDLDEDEVFEVLAFTSEQNPPDTVVHVDMFKEKNSRLCHVRRLLVSESPSADWSLDVQDVSGSGTREVVLHGAAGANSETYTIIDCNYNILLQCSARGKMELEYRGEGKPDRIYITDRGQYHGGAFADEDWVRLTYERDGASFVHVKTERTEGWSRPAERPRK